MSVTGEGGKSCRSKGSWRAVCSDSLAISARRDFGCSSVVTEFVMSAVVAFSLWSVGLG